MMTTALTKELLSTLAYMDQMETEFRDDLRRIRIIRAEVDGCLADIRADSENPQQPPVCLPPRRGRQAGQSGQNKSPAAEGDESCPTKETI